ncbi:hypothetical protein BJ508DRAFT_311220 [Ascobolus immersus RN42]|uniref:Protein kinase domain-containing protein n=1 Tax=Ascobolus immersus RN42 TaxID=1160509 RepID=A0A3N4HTF3_ASCIM|nr:hypothetical protein BJ508DRAFT_311220 [Ascobolus immersus RN42]
MLSIFTLFLFALIPALFARPYPTPRDLAQHPFFDPTLHGPSDAYKQTRHVLNTYNHLTRQPPGVDDTPTTHSVYSPPEAQGTNMRAFLGTAPLWFRVRLMDMVSDLLRRWNPWGRLTAPSPELEAMVTDVPDIIG